MNGSKKIKVLALKSLSLYFSAFSLYFLYFLYPIPCTYRYKEKSGLNNAFELNQKMLFFHQTIAIDI